MKAFQLLSAIIICGLSTIVAAQTQSPPKVNLGLNLGPGTVPPKPASPGSGLKQPIDVNEIIKTGVIFTNGMGMVIKKVGTLWVSAHETTQQAYQKVSGSNPSAFIGTKRPVDSVSWQEAMRFCDQLTAEEKKSDLLPHGFRYALPTQAQWESLAAGVPLAASITSSGARRSGPAEVGSLAPSPGGLYDLRGNVAEWCADPADGTFRVLRGGSWADWIEVNLRPEFRVYAAPTEAKNTYGFRCVLVPDK